MSKLPKEISQKISKLRREKENAKKRYPRYFELLDLIWECYVFLQKDIDWLFFQIEQVKAPFFFWSECECNFPSEFAKWKQTRSFRFLPVSISDLPVSQFESLRADFLIAIEEADILYGSICA